MPLIKSSLSPIESKLSTGLTVVDVSKSDSLRLDIFDSFLDSLRVLFEVDPATGKPAMFKISLHNILSFIRISYTDTQRTHTHQQLYANQRLPAHNLFFFYLVCTQSKPLPLSLPSYTHQQDSFHFIFSLRFFIPNQNNNACFSKHKHD